ncbi:MAG: hypothetical protein GY859_07150 [Desulfobacterales bacterium]|nr:hypothetical protein [Desulfobacterales bacterium]
MAALKKRVFISDIHMGDNRSANPGGGLAPYGWFLNVDNSSRKRPEMLAEFLGKHVIPDESIHELVILGDFFDEWICSSDFSPWETAGVNQLVSIANAEPNKTIVNHLKILAREGRLVYATGNHDMLITRGDSRDALADIFEGITYIGENGLGVHRTDDGIYALHGHNYTLFNCPWMDRSGTSGLEASILPMGFFISRMEACYTAVKGKAYGFERLVRDAILKKLFHKKPGGADVDASVFDWSAVSEDVYLELDKVLANCFNIFRNDDVFKGRAGVSMDGLDNVPGLATWEEIDHRHANMMADWDEFHPVNVRSPLALFNEFESLSSAVEHIIDHHNSKIVIMGHTHKCAYHRWARARAFRIYANTGAWVNAKPATYALTEYNADAGEHTVEVYEYTDAGPKRLNGGTVKV